MLPEPSSVDVLLRELASGAVVPSSYSRRSVYGRFEPLLVTTALALVAVLAGMMLGRSADRRRSVEQHRSV